ncbi:hypothetical protein AU359_02162 [Micrococcus luteus]|uniref:TniB family NTP-binding protein n=1 Tax=Micrococcus luteus TaxID=1270 RepID=UPI0007638BF4|nr:TniB family NTP-binding protein [Micrococcus luteus]KWW32705.1 hypothetical protein AU359_02162 [Micrococcus luteus]
MDALLWHTQALTPAPAPPEPVLLREFSTLSTQDQDEYWTRMHRWMCASTLDCDRTAAIRRGMDRVLQRNEYARSGAKTIIGLSAPNGVGKSTFIKFYAQDRYQRMMHDQPVDKLPSRTDSGGSPSHWIPQVYITLRAASEVPDVNAAILSYLGYPIMGRTTKDTTLLVHAVARHGVKLLILDDAHMLRAKQARARDVLDYVKFLNTMMGERDGTLVLVGANMEGGPVYQDPQVAARLRAFALQPYTVQQDTTERVAWQQLLAGAEKKFMPYLDSATEGTLTRELAGQIWARTQGHLGDTHQLITTALLDAFDQGDTTLVSEHLQGVRLSARAEAAEADLAREATLTSRREQNRKAKR